MKIYESATDPPMSEKAAVTAGAACNSWIWRQADTNLRAARLSLTSAHQLRSSLALIILKLSQRLTCIKDETVELSFFVSGPLQAELVSMQLWLIRLSQGVFVQMLK